MEETDRAAYETVFDWKFVSVSDVDAACASDLAFSPVILPQSLIGDVPDFSGKHVAVVGNGVVRDSGRAIDGSDIVIRLNRMYSWQRDPQHDGQRVDIWAGLPVFAVDDLRASAAAWDSSSFASVARDLKLIWCLSQFHCSARAYRFLRDAGLLGRFRSTDCLDRLIGRHTDALDPALIVHLQQRPTLFHGRTGLSRYELLLTGVRCALQVYLGGAKSLDLYGFDFFKTAGSLWEGHDLDSDDVVLRFLAERAERLGCAFRLHHRDPSAPA